jgi:hypothetical protein
MRWYKLIRHPHSRDRVTCLLTLAEVTEHSIETRFRVQTMRQLHGGAPETGEGMSAATLLRGCQHAPGASQKGWNLPFAVIGRIGHLLSVGAKKIT